MDIRLGVASYMMAKIELESTVDRSILLEDEGFINLFTSILNVDKLDLDAGINQLVEYVINNY